MGPGPGAKFTDLGGTRGVGYFLCGALFVTVGLRDYGAHDTGFISKRRCVWQGWASARSGFRVAACMGNKRVLVWGAGGHGKVIVDALLAGGEWKVAGGFGEDEKKRGGGGFGGEGVSV